MKPTALRILLSSAAAAALATSFRGFAAEVPPPADRAADVLAETPSGNVLGATFESDSAGISLRIPVGCRRILSTNTGDDIAQFGDQDRKWQLKLTRIFRAQPTTLQTGVDNFGKPVPGLLDTTVANLKRDLSGCTILRQDLTNIADAGAANVRNNVAMIALRYTVGGTDYLSQQAIIQASDKLFYLMSLTTPAGKNAPGTGVDPEERAAVEAFRQMLDSTHLLDTASIRREQDARLFRTHALLYQMKSKIRMNQALIGEQWLRVMRNGHDVGYSYITEQVADGIPRPLTAQELAKGMGDRDLVRNDKANGILVGIRSRMINPPEVFDGKQKPKGPTQVDNATWLFVTPDQRLEDWSRITVINDGTMGRDGKPILHETTEFGTSNIEEKRELDKDALPGTKLDPKQPPVSIREHHHLNVTAIGDTGAAAPVDQEVPRFYLPQALGQLLPRLLPLRLEADGEPRTYMFATYVQETRQVMSRYVEVGKEGDFVLAGKPIHAIPITDRLGWNGSITTHYVSPDGKYLGSENKDAHTVILPTDAATLLGIWKGANLTQPGGIQRPHAGPTNTTEPPPSSPVQGPAAPDR
jgi:hypothetical protein